MAVPVAPHIRGYVVSPGKVKIVWDAVPGATQYDLYRGTTRGNETLHDDDVTSPYIDDLTVDTRGVYSVVAHNSDGDGDASNYVSVQNGGVDGNESNGDTGTTELDYVAFTSPVSVTASSEETADTVVASNAIDCTGDDIIIEFFAPGLDPQATGNSALIVMLYEDSKLLGYIASARTPAAGAMRAPCLAKMRRTPSAGSHTYTVKAWTTSGTAAIDAGAGGTGDYIAGYIRVSTA